MPRTPEIIDVSVFLRPGMPQWDGEELAATEALLRTPADEVNVTLLTMTTHTGTHVDAPRHFIDGGKTLDQFPLDRWVGPCLVVDFTALDADITSDDLEQANIPPGVERLVFKTRNSEIWRSHPHGFFEDFIALAPSGARWAVERGVRLVAIDYLSIGAVTSDGSDTHITLLSNDVLIVEGLDLTHLRPGAYELLCFPLNLPGLDGAPARVALRAMGPR